MDISGITEVQDAFYENELISAFSVSSPATVQWSADFVPPITEVSRNRIVKIDSCLSSKVLFIDSNDTVRLLGTTSLFNWNIRTEQGHKIGSLSRNLLGTEYTLKNRQENKEVCFIKHFGLYSNTGPRVFNVYTNSKDTLYKLNLSERVKKKKNQYIRLQNKPPYFSYETNSYVLNFNGRVTMPSTRNFQIIHPKDTSFITMTFGKTSHNEYILDYTYPWSGMEAFGVALSSFGSILGID
ncbi:tubby [Nematocida minor]|uniref:tubby n=1 Tax=Nematocida minor TaxID=1912983 RepID=UPI00221F7BAE|nr:tubby [Nematocida minor]KAI5189140.1 tubby [Nematocida minor]